MFRMEFREILVVLFLLTIAGITQGAKIKTLVFESNYSTKRFDEWTWLTSHNSHLNWHDSSVMYLLSNQNLSIDEQLAHGVRGFMFDIDYIKCSYLDQLFSTCNCEGKSDRVGE